MSTQHRLTAKWRNYRLNKILEKPLPESNTEEHECNILASRSTTAIVATQTIPFKSLPAEIRNRIYEYALPSSEDELIVATPFRDDLMSMGVQPAITKVSKQLRSESLEIFYVNKTFVAYIKDFDFGPLLRWVDATTSGTPPRKVTVQVKLLDNMRCTRRLFYLMRAWRDLKHHTAHLRIHNCFTGLPVPRRPGFDQRELVARAIDTAEKLCQNGRVSESDLLDEYHKRFDVFDEVYLGATSKGQSDNCLYSRACVYHIHDDALEMHEGHVNGWL